MAVTNPTRMSHGRNTPGPGTSASAASKPGPASQLGPLGPARAGGSCGNCDRITFVDTDARAGVSAISARSERAAGDWRSDILFLSERLSETLFIGQPLQRMSPAASARPQKNRSTFCQFRQLPPALARPEAQAVTDAGPGLLAAEALVPCPGVFPGS